MPTVCATCNWLIVPEGQRSKWWAWTCAAHKIPPLFNPVTGNNDAQQPYKRCAKVNDGECPDYEAGPTILNPRPMAEAK